MLQKQFILLKCKCKPCNKGLKKKIRKIIDRTNYVSCLGIKIDENINWKFHLLACKH